jgi:diadenosine tetraphosphatase ApaH/serine/threonine PP2A family protein phosphatase
VGGDMIAILSDIHGNLEAITAVLADVSRQGVRTVYNLGDTLGYGPNPVECLDLAMRMQVVLMGNFDNAVLYKPDGFCRSAEESVLWARAVLDSNGTKSAGSSRLEFLGSLPGSHSEGDVLFVHGSPRNQMNEYFFPEDIYNEPKLRKSFMLFDHICFNGHTHIPGIILQPGTAKWEFVYPEECDKGFPTKERKFICNVGSVGQPRDEDPRACYVLFDGETIRYRRVEYNIETTIRKIYAIPQLDNFLGDRLREGH